MSEPIKGNRNDVEPHLYEEGDYGKWKSGWYCRPPGTELLGNITNHTLTEHEDGTLTASPSIRITGGQGNEWHGFLERGVWRTV